MESSPHRPQGEKQECRPDQQQIEPDVRVRRPHRDQPLPRRESGAVGGRGQQGVCAPSRQSTAKHAPARNVDTTERKDAQRMLDEPTDELDQGCTVGIKFRLLANPAATH